MEPLSIRVSDYVVDDLNLAPRNQHRSTFSARSSTEPDAAAAADGAYFDAHWHERAGYLFGVPASSKSMEGLRAPAVGATREQCCAVCLDEFEEGDELRMMPCSHSFHQRCIFPWLRVSRLCPYCRFPLPSDEEQRLLDEQAAGAQPGATTNRG